MGGLETLARGQHADAEAAAVVTVTDEAAYEALWATLRDAPARPRVDFATHTVIAALAGRKPTGGYGIEITGVDPVTTAEREPDGFVIQALTSPYHVVRAPSR